MKGLFHWAYCTNRYALLLPLLLYGLHALTGQLFFVRVVRCAVSGGSTACATQIQDYVESIRFYSARWIVKQVIKQFPCIDDISVVRTVDQVLYCDVSIKNIAYSVNDEYVITTDNNLFGASYFDPFLIQQAKKCLAQKDILFKYPEKIVSYLNNLNDDIFSLYNVSIKNEYDVRLCPRLTTEFYIKCTLESSFNNNILDEVIKQIPNLKKSYPIIFKNNQYMVIDMRFKDQIIFTKEEKGIV